MTRIIHEHAPTEVYDNLTDEWTRHPTPEAAQAYVLEANPQYVNPTVEASGSTRISTVSLTLASAGSSTSGPIMLAPLDPSRQRVHLSVFPTGGTVLTTLYVGSFADVASGKGYAIPLLYSATAVQYETVQFRTTAELWVAAVASTSGTSYGTIVVSALMESDD